MGADSKNKAEDLFMAALEVSDAERAAFLDAQCGDDAALRGEVESLLSFGAEVRSFLDGPSAGGGGRATIPDLPGANGKPMPDGMRVGPYSLVKIIAEDGVGIVYLAEQAPPERRQVALKIIKQGIDTGLMVVRFEAVRQALAGLDHPGLARVLDAGTTEQGWPYFVMEHVDGIPLTEHCDRRRLSVRARLALMLSVCDAVQHGHQKGLIHRDLRPASMLVVEKGGRVTPRVVGFGVGAALDQRLTEQTIYNAQKRCVASPEYVSPEQARVGDLDVDTRADVYSLGAVLYELLAGVPPFDPKRLRKAKFEKMQRTIRETVPAEPSARLSAADDARRAAKCRGTDVEALRAQLRGDLDWIVMRALDKDRTRRYGSVGELAADLRRHLADEPVVAAPRSGRYVVGKFAKRHAGGVAMAGVGLMAVLVLAALGLLELVSTGGPQPQANPAPVSVGATNEELESARIVARQERQRAEQLEAELQAARQAEDAQRQLAEQSLATAERQARQVAALQAFQGEMLAHVADEDTSIDSLADVGQRAGRAFADQPQLEAAVRVALGRRYRRAQMLQEAEAQFARAAELRRGALGDDHPETQTVQAALQDVRDQRARALAAAQPEPPPETEATVAANDAPPVPDVPAQEPAHEPADAPPTVVVERPADTGGGEAQDGPAAEETSSDPVLVDTTPPTTQEPPVVQEPLEPPARELAAVLVEQGNYIEAEPLLRQVLDETRDEFGDDHPASLAAAEHLAAVVWALGQFGEAEGLYRAVLERRRQRSGDAAATGGTMTALAELLKLQGKLAEAEPLYREIVAHDRATLGDAHETTLARMDTLAGVLHAQGKEVEAAALYRAVLDTRRRVLGPDHDATIETTNALAALAYAEGRYVEAEPLYRQAYASRLRTLGAEHAETLLSMSNLAEVLVAQEKFTEARPILHDLVRGAEQTLAESHPSYVAVYRANYAQCLYRMQDYAEAAPVLERSFEGLRDTLGLDDDQTLLVLWMLIDTCDALEQRDKADEYRGLLQQAQERRDESISAGGGRQPGSDES